MPVTVVLETVAGMERLRAVLDGATASGLMRLSGDGAFELDGAVTAKAWLKQHTNTAGATAAQRLRTAKILVELAKLHETMAAGRLSTDQVRIVVSRWRPSTRDAYLRDEAMLIEVALVTHIDDLPRVMDLWEAMIDPDGVDPETRRADRRVHLSQTLDGDWSLDGRLPADDGVVLNEALLAAMADLAPSQRADGTPMTPAHKRADALVHLARRYLFGTPRPGPRWGRRWGP